jgi:hypothetical protein
VEGVSISLTWEMRRLREGVTVMPEGRFGVAKDVVGVEGIEGGEMGSDLTLETGERGYSPWEMKEFEGGVLLRSVVWDAWMAANAGLWNMLLRSSDLVSSLSSCSVGHEKAATPKSDRFSCHF